MVPTCGAYRSLHAFTMFYRNDTNHFKRLNGTEKSSLIVHFWKKEFSSFFLM